MGLRDWEALASYISGRESTQKEKRGSSVRGVGPRPLGIFYTFSFLQREAAILRPEVDGSLAWTTGCGSTPPCKRPKSVLRDWLLEWTEQKTHREARLASSQESAMPNHMFLRVRPVQWRHRSNVEMAHTTIVGGNMVLMSIHFHPKHIASSVVMARLKHIQTVGIKKASQPSAPPSPSDRPTRKCRDSVSGRGSCPRPVRVHDRGHHKSHRLVM